MKPLGPEKPLIWTKCSQLPATQFHFPNFRRTSWKRSLFFNYYLSSLYFFWEYIVHDSWANWERCKNVLPYDWSRKKKSFRHNQQIWRPWCSVIDASMVHQSPALYASQCWAFTGVSADITKPHYLAAFYAAQCWDFKTTWPRPQWNSFQELVFRQEISSGYRYIYGWFFSDILRFRSHG